jgi:UDP-3-O-[3-hydroxymyristoyl] glucosamine N-acyltransferase LpxD
MPTTKEIAQFLNLQLFGSSNTIIDKVASFPPKHSEVSFIKKSDNKIDEILKNNKGCDCLIIADISLKNIVDLSCSNFIFSQQPKYDLARVHWNFFNVNNNSSEEDFSITSNNSIIGRLVKIGRDVDIGPGCVLLGDIEIGSGSKIGSNVVIKNKVILGENVTVLSGAVIGENAFSYGFGVKGESIIFPSLSGVVIEDNVRIGNNVTISRGIFENTEICCGVIIDDLTNVGNAAKIGKNCKIMANCSISGRVTLMNNCFLGRGSSIKQGVKIGRNSILGMGSVIVSDIDKDIVAYGVPAKFKRTLL